MKKTTVILLGIICSIQLWAGESVPMYHIINDTLNKDVPAGKCLVYGTITFENQPINSGKVSTIDHQFDGVSDTAGVFSFLMNTDKTKLYAFQIGFREVVTDDHVFNSGHAVHIKFYLQVQHEMIMQEKPVIYMYSPNPLSANVTLDLKGELTFTYPKYENGWNVEVSSSGKLKDLNSGKIYPYLFWEGETENLKFTSSFDAFDGYQINTDSTISFLESKLWELGLNEREQTDFITYWAPRIVQEQYATIQFLIDEDYGKEIGELAVNPKPDCIRRVYMLFSSSGSPANEFNSTLKKIESFQRKGFTVIEWGGSEIELILDTSKL